MPQPRRRPMRGAESLLWTIGRDPVLRSTVVAILVLDHSPEDKELYSAFDDLAAVVPRMAMRIAPPRAGVGRPAWVPAAEFTLSQHVHRLAAPSPGTLRPVLDVAEAMAGSAFDPNLPPWEALLVEGMADGRAALVIKMHHSMVDGVGGLQALFDVTGPGPGDAEAPPSPGGGVAAARRVAEAVVTSGTRAIRHPAATASTLAHGAATVSRLLAPAPAPLSPVLRGRGQLRRADVLQVPLPALREVARRAGASVNDVFVTAVLDGLHGYHRARGAPVTRLRGTIPVDIRRPGERGGNHFVPARFVFPLSPGSLPSRVRTTHRVLHDAVHDPWLAVSDLLAEGLARLPAPAATAVFGSMLKGADFIATDLQGPVRPLVLAGATVEEIFALAPPAGAAVNVSLVTVGDLGCVGVVADTTAVEDPDALQLSFAGAFAEIARSASTPTRPRVRVVR